MNKTVLVFSTIHLTCFGLSAAEFSIADIGVGRAYDMNSSGKVAASINNVAVVFDGQTATQIVIPQFIQHPWGWEPLHPTACIAVSDSGWLVVLHQGMQSHFIYNQDSGAFPGGYPDGTALKSINSTGRAVGTVDYTADNVFQNQGIQTPPYSLISGHSSLNDINETGVMAGSLSTNSIVTSDFPLRIRWYPRRAALFQNGQAQLIDQRVIPEYFWGSELDDWSAATSVNSQQWVAGWQRAVFQGNRRAFLFQGSQLLDLGTFGGNESIALDLNDDGVVVGWAHSASGNKRAFIYRDAIMTDLNDLIPTSSGWVLEEAVAVNNNGQVAGNGKFNGADHAFLLNPKGLGVPPSITIQPTGGGVMGIGSELVLSVTAGGDAPLSHQWFKDDSELPGQTASMLIIQELEKSDAGEYWVRVSNNYGIAISVQISIEVADALLEINTYAGILITGQVGASYQLEYKTDVNSNTWHTLSEIFVLAGNPQLYIDASAPATGRRIYRAVKIE